MCIIELLVEQLDMSAEQLQNPTASAAAVRAPARRYRGDMETHMMTAIDIGTINIEKMLSGPIFSYIVTPLPSKYLF